MGEKHGRNGIAFCRRLVVLALAGLWLNAHAITWNKSTDFAWNVGTGNITAFPSAGSGNIWATGAKAAESDGFTFRGPPKQLPFNPSPTFNFKAKFKPADLARSLARPASGLLVPIIAGAALDILMQEACVRIAGGSMQLASGGQWEECHFSTQAQTQYRGYCISGLGVNDCWQGGVIGGTKQWYSDKASAGAAATAAAAQSQPTGFQGCFQRVYHYTWTATSGGIKITRTWPGGECTNGTAFGEGSEDFFGTDETQTAQVQVRDGWESATADQAESALESKLNAWTQSDFLYGYDANRVESFGGATDTWMNSGGSVDLAPSSISAPDITPSVITDPPFNTIKSLPGGGTETDTTTTEHDYSCTVLTAQGQVTCSQYNKTTTTTNTTDPSNPSGTTTTSTTTSTQDTSKDDPCTAHPDRAGCADLDIPVSPIPKSSFSVTYAAEVLGLSGGSCPADKMVTLHGVTVKVFDMATACGWITDYLKPLVLAICTFIAFVIVMPGNVKGDIA